MSPLLIFGLCLVALTIAFIVFIATRSNDFVVERSRRIEAASTAVFPLLNDFQLWRRWSPWEELDPNLQRNYEGPPAGVGAAYSWSGNNKAGAGKMTIENSTPSEELVIRLEFTKPFAATNKTVFRLTPQDGGTVVVWTMTGTNNFIGKIFWLLMNLEKMVGADFEKGLSQLERAALSAG